MKEDAAHRTFALLAVSASSFLTPFMGSAINLALPSISLQFNPSTFLLSWVATGYLLTSAAFLLPLGRLADIVGRRKVFLWGVEIFILFSLLCSLSRSIEALIAFRVLQGIGGSMIFGTGVAILTSIYPPQERGKVMGINVAAVYIGLSLGPVLGGVLNYNFGWQSIFLFNAVVGICTLAITLWKVRGEWTGASGERFDHFGAFLYIVGLIALVYGFSSVTAAYWARYCLLAGAAVLALFAVWECRTSQPIADLRLFRSNQAFTFSNLAALINYSATYAVSFVLSLHLQVIMGLNSQYAGLILLLQPLIMAVLSPFAGMLSDRVQPRVAASCGMSLVAVGLLLFALILNWHTALWLLLLTQAILGTGFALFSSPNTNAVMGAVDKRFYGIASSTLSTMRTVGQAMSMAIVTLLMAYYTGGVSLKAARPDLLLRGSRVAFGVFTVLCVIGVFASLARGNVSIGPQEETGRS